MKIALNALDSGRYSLAAGTTGICQAALEASLRYAGERTQFGKPNASLQLVQQLLAEIYLDTEAARALYWKVTWKHDEGEPHTIESSVAKMFCSEAAVRCADKAVEVHGRYGYVDEYPVVRTCATRGCSRCTRAPARSSGCCWAATSPARTRSRERAGTARRPARHLEAAPLRADPPHSTARRGDPQDPR